jgi:hypothetical protein
LTELIEQIYHDNNLLAIIIRADYHADGIQFFTPANFSQQLGYMHRPAGFKIEPHLHNEVRREVLLTQEVLIVRNGRLKVNFYDCKRNYATSRELTGGDVILLASGGHGFEVIEQAEILEVKQGPYSGDDDKTRFIPSTGEF